MAAQSQRLHRGDGASETEAAVPGSGRLLDPELRAEMAARLGHPVEPDVRVHTGAPAWALARSVDAEAYTVGKDVVFGEGAYDPGSARGRDLLAHELTHVAQQRGGSPARPGAAPAAALEGQARAAEAGHGGVAVTGGAPVGIARKPKDPKPPPPRDPTFDEILAELGTAFGGPYATYADFAASMVPASFLGHSIQNGVRQELKDKLAKADKDIRKAWPTAPADFGISFIGGFRSRSGPHGWGLAIDIDGTANPYVMHEAGEGKIDTQVAPVYHRIAEMMLNSPVDNEQSVIPKLILRSDSTSLTAAHPSRADRIGAFYDRLALESTAMHDYFALMKNPDPKAIPDFLAGPWQKTHPGATPPAPAKVLADMWADYALLGGTIPAGVTGVPTPPAASGSRPFSSSGADPAKGILTIPKEVVLGLTAHLTRWGAVDFGVESGDVMHFDDMGGLGTAVSAAKKAAADKIAAAAAAAQTATPPATTTTPPTTTTTSPTTTPTTTTPPTTTAPPSTQPQQTKP